MIKLYIDDLRRPPDMSWTLVKDTAEAIEFVSTNGCPEQISFDYCLANGLTVMPFIEWLIEKDNSEKGRFFPKDFKYTVHSSSISGTQLIYNTLDTYFKNRG